MKFNSISSGFLKNSLIMQSYWIIVGVSLHCREKGCTQVCFDPADNLYLVDSEDSQIVYIDPWIIYPDPSKTRRDLWTSAPQMSWVFKFKIVQAANVWLMITYGWRSWYFNIFHHVLTVEIRLYLPLWQFLRILPAAGGSTMPGPAPKIMLIDPYSTYRWDEGDCTLL